jgi:hypothetical protein
MRLTTSLHAALSKARAPAVRAGVVAEATVDVLAARLMIELPGLPDREIRAIARKQAEDLRAAGWRITAPAAALAPGQRRAKGAPRMQQGGELSLARRMQYTVASNVTALAVFCGGLWATGHWLLPFLQHAGAVSVWLEMTSR